MKRLIFLLIVFSIILFTGCSQLNKATDLVTNPTAKERYQRDFDVSEELYTLWENQVELALQDSIQIETPFLQAGHFKPKSFPVYSYYLDLNVGERFDVIVETDSTSQLAFIDLYRIKNDSLGTFEKIASAGFERKTLSSEVEHSGTYKVIIQPEINASTPFRIKMKTSPVYSFPVAGGKNTNIQSFWGASRDAGRRSHEGIDIFAPRGTPVVAVTEGRITSSGERGLGGKQVWVRDSKRGQSLYYAHLDSIPTIKNSRVKAGDTIGFVGNTGNARTTAPHLHFGIYRGYRGAIDPLHYVFQFDEPGFEPVGNLPETLNLVTKSTANLRDKPTTNKSRILRSSNPQDTLIALGKTNDWFHIRTADKKAAFIHESLVTPL